MPVRETLQSLMEGVEPNADARSEAQLWLARAEVFLDWVAQHPHLFEINCEAARLLSMYRGVPVHAVDADYRGVAPKPKPHDPVASPPQS